MEDLIILVDDRDHQIGTTPKATVHTKDTPLHRAFSVYVFRQDGKVLIQQRKQEKPTWGGFWSNSCCGHPRPGEKREEALKRRTREELGVRVHRIEQIAPYRYRFEYNNVAENEICPIFVGMSDDTVIPDPNEIEGFVWVDWSELLRDVERNADIYSPWSKEQVGILRDNVAFQDWLLRNHMRLT